MRIFKSFIQYTAILALVLSSHFSFAQYFQTVWNNNPFQPMNIIVQSGTVNNSDLEIGDEIALFDEDSNGDLICVGMATVQDAVSPTTPLIVIASTDDGTTNDMDGFIDGHEIVFKVWDSSEATEISNITADYNASYSSNYTSLGTAVVQISNCQMGDIDCDCDIDIIDITQVAYCFGTSLGDDLYNPAFDFDNDGDIDIIDITMVAYWFGWSCGD